MNDLLTTYENQKMWNSENCASSQNLGIREAAGIMSNPSCRMNGESNYVGYGCPYVPGLEITNNGALPLESGNGVLQPSPPDCGNSVLQPVPNETFAGGQPDCSTASIPGCSSDQSINIPVADSGRTVQASADGSSATTTVQANDSLWKISSDLLGSNASNAQIQDMCQQIAQSNNINNPNDIQPGQSLNIPNPGNIPAVENALPNVCATSNLPGGGDGGLQSQPGSAANGDQPMTPSSLDQMIKNDIGNGSSEQAYQDLESNINSLSGQDQEVLKAQLKSDNLMPELAAGAVQSSLDQSGNSSFSYDDALGMSKNNPVDKQIANYVQNNFDAMAGVTSYADPNSQQILPGALSNWESAQAGNLNLPDQQVSSLMQTIQSDIAGSNDETAYQNMESGLSSLTNQQQQTLQAQLASGNFMSALSAGAVEYAMDQSGSSSFSMGDAQNLPSGSAIDQAIAQFVQDTGNFNAMAGSTGGGFDAGDSADITSDSLQAYESGDDSQS